MVIKNTLLNSKQTSDSNSIKSGGSRKFIEIDTPETYGFILNSIRSIFNYISGSYSFSLGENIKVELFSKGNAGIASVDLGEYYFSLQPGKIIADLKYLDLSIDDKKINVNFDKVTNIVFSTLNLYVTDFIGKLNSFEATISKFILKISNGEVNISSLKGAINILEMVLRTVSVSIAGPLSINTLSADIKSSGPIDLNSSTGTISINSTIGTAVSTGGPPPVIIPGTVTLQAPIATYVNSPMTYLDSTPFFHMTNAESTIAILTMISTILKQISASYLPLDVTVPLVINGQIAAVESMIPSILNPKVMG